MSQPGFDPAIVVGASEAQATAADPAFWLIGWRACCWRARGPTAFCA